MIRPIPARAPRLLAGAAVLTLSMAACGSNSSTPAATDTNSTPASTDSSSSSTSTAPTTASYKNFKCAGNATSKTGFKVAGILPLTGSLAYLGPPEIAGVGLAVNDINAAGGVNGKDACNDIEDSGDSADLSVSTKTANQLVAGDPSVVIGAASSSVSLNVVGTFTSNKVTEISPANTSVELSGKSPFYFRTAPPDGVQGSALGTLVSTDGNSRVAFIVFNDPYGTGLRDAVQKTIETAGGSCTYGCTGDGNEFPPGQTTFSSEVSAALASKPDAIVVLAFDETKAIIPELKSQGFDMSKIYLSDGNTADYSADFAKGTLTGAQGTIPGADPDAAFKDKLQGWAKVGEGKALKDYAYGAESYDATILAALAATRGGANDTVTVQKNLLAVSGAEANSTKCTSYADCLTLLKAGKEIYYTGPSGIGPLDDQHDPSSAFIGIFTYDASNKNTLTSTVQGTK